MKPGHLQQAPKTPNFDKEAELTVEYDGVPPLSPTYSKKGIVIFTNFTRIFVRESGHVQEIAARANEDVVVVQDGGMLCRGSQARCSWAASTAEPMHIDLQGGSISPALVSFGSPLGLQEIMAESSTNDGYVYDPILREVPSILGDESVIRAADGLQYSTRHAL